MIRLISIGTDRRVFEPGSSVRNRLVKQAGQFSELHVIVFSRRSAGLRAQQLGNLWLYPTNSLSRFLYIRDAAALARAIAMQRGMTGTDSVLTAQDPFECGFAGWRASQGGAHLPLQIQIHTDFLSPEFAAHSFLNRIRVRIARYVLPHAAGIRVVSSRIAESLRVSGIPLRTTIEVLPVFSEQAVVWGEKPLRRFHPGQNNGCLILMAARLSPEKDFGTALRALQLVRRTNNAVGMVIAGEGPEEGKIRAELTARSLSGAVKMELWQSDLASFYRVSDVVLVTSRFEGYGLVMLEAAIHAKPVVTTDVGIARELVPPDFRRFVCPVGDSVQIGERLSELAADLKLRSAYGLALRTSAKKFLVPEDKYLQRYRELIERCVIKLV